MPSIQTAAKTCNFYPRPPRGGRQPERHLYSYANKISIHALREEGDRQSRQGDPDVVQFLSTPSARRATRPPSGRSRGCSNFYPRPPRGGRHTLHGSFYRSFYFYPRPPRGGRPFSRSLSSTARLFLSTPSARRATDGLLALDALLQFLSTPSARRATVDDPAVLSTTSDFYPRPPRGGRRSTAEAGLPNVSDFYPRPPRGGRPPAACGRRAPSAISIHALREEGD